MLAVLRNADIWPARSFAIPGTSVVLQKAIADVGASSAARGEQNSEIPPCPEHCRADSTYCTNKVRRVESCETKQAGFTVEREGQYQY